MKLIALGPKLIRHCKFVSGWNWDWVT